MTMSTPFQSFNGPPFLFLKFFDGKLFVCRVCRLLPRISGIPATARWSHGVLESGQPGNLPHAWSARTAKALPVLEM